MILRYFYIRYSFIVFLNYFDTNLCQYWKVMPLRPWVWLMHRQAVRGWLSVKLPPMTHSAREKEETIFPGQMFFQLSCSLVKQRPHVRSTVPRLSRARGYFEKYSVVNELAYRNHLIFFRLFPRYSVWMSHQRDVFGQSILSIERPTDPC